MVHKLVPLCVALVGFRGNDSDNSDWDEYCWFRGTTSPEEEEGKYFVLIAFLRGASSFAGAAAGRSVAADRGVLV